MPLADILPVAQWYGTRRLAGGPGWAIDSATGSCAPPGTDGGSTAAATDEGERGSMSTGWRLIVYGVILGWLVLAPAQAQELPIFDTHIHYSRPDWHVLAPASFKCCMCHQRRRINAELCSGRLCMRQHAPYKFFACGRRPAGALCV